MKGTERSEDVIDNLHFCINLKTIKLVNVCSSAVMHFCTLLSQHLWENLDKLIFKKIDLAISFSKFATTIVKEKCLNHITSLTIADCKLNDEQLQSLGEALEEGSCPELLNLDLSSIYYYYYIIKI